MQLEPDKGSYRVKRHIAKLPDVRDGLYIYIIMSQQSRDTSFFRKPHRQALDQVVVIRETILVHSVEQQVHMVRHQAVAQ